MRRNDELRHLVRLLTALAESSITFRNIGDEGLLNLRVKIDLRLLNEDQHAQWSILRRHQPLRVEMPRLDGHIDQILEAETVVKFRQLVFPAGIDV